MKKQLLVALTTGVICTSVIAQSAFEGFYGQIATGYENNYVSPLVAPTTIVTDGVSVFRTKEASSQSVSGVPLVLGVGYSFQVFPDWLIGIGGDYSVLSQTTSNYTVKNRNDTFPNPNNTIKFSNRYNLFISPGFALDNDKLIYVKAGYSSEQTTANNGGTTPSTSFVTNRSGYIVGLGYKQIITKGLYGYGEFNYMNYGNKATTNSWANTANGSYSSQQSNPMVSA